MDKLSGELDRQARALLVPPPAEVQLLGAALSPEQLRALLEGAQLPRDGALRT